jgi:predicted nucleic-acid-binding protein
MRGMDTNILVRYLTADEPRQCAAAERVIENAGGMRSRYT